MKRVILFLILLLAFLLRVIWLDKIPIGFTPDEASFGYDAYSILNTGNDQWGRRFPLVLESFGDFKLPLYSYISIPSILIFNLNKFSVRLPNAIFGTLAVYITFLVVLELSRFLPDDYIMKKKKITIIGIEYKEFTAYLASFLLAISSWHVMMSRGAFEANLTTFLLPLGLYIFLKGFKNNKYIVLSAIIFGVNLFSYHSARLVTPLFVFLLTIFFYKNIKKLPKKTIILSSFIFIAFTGLAFYTLFIGGAKRAQDVSVFSGALSQAAEERTIAIFRGSNTFFARIMHNKYQVIIDRFLNNYPQYFSYRYLFTDGPSEATYGMIPGRGVLYWFELPFIIGILYAFFRNKGNKIITFILVWLMLTPIPAALTNGRGFAGNRATIMIPALQILLSFGAVSLIILVKNLIKQFNLFLLAYSIFGFIIFSGFLLDYFYLYPSDIVSRGMLSGNLESAQWLSSNIDNKTVYVSRNLSEPHIYIAFANKWDPIKYQLNTVNWIDYRNKNLLFLDQLEGYKLGNYIFGSIKYDENKNDVNSIMVGKPEEFPSNVKIMKEFSYPSGSASVLIVDPNNQAYAKSY